MRGLRVLVLAPALGEHELLVLAEHRKLADIRQIAGEAAVGRDDG